MQEDKITLKILDDTIKDVQEINTKLVNVLKTSKQGLIQIQNERNQLEKEKKERDQKIGQMTEEQMRLLEEYAKVKEELKKFAKIAASMEDQELDFDKIQALLSIYTILLEKIFQGQPHFRVLILSCFTTGIQFVLHGAKDKMTREELKNTTGIQGAMVLRAVQDLDKVGLIEYDMETSTAKLMKRLYPKPSIEGKKK